MIKNLLLETYKNFKDLSYYQDYDKYKLFPFNFKNIDDNNVILTTDEGEFIFTTKHYLKKIINKKISYKNEPLLFLELINKQFIYLKQDKEALNRKIIKYRTKKQFLSTGPVLHVFVVTTRCQHKCHYCQITPQNQSALEYDMSQEIARKSVETMMQAPSESITVEFQGGETLLAFDIVMDIILYTKELNVKYNKKIDFVLATSLVDINKDHLEFIREHKIMISTSLDGPEFLHNHNRPINSQNTYHKFLEGYHLSEEYVEDTISPLLTISKRSLTELESIIFEYQKFGQDSISLRALSPYGFAVKTMGKI